MAVAAVAVGQSRSAQLPAVVLQRRLTWACLASASCRPKHLQSLTIVAGYSSDYTSDYSCNYTSTTLFSENHKNLEVGRSDAGMLHPGGSPQEGGTGLVEVGRQNLCPCRHRHV